MRGHLLVCPARVRARGDDSTRARTYRRGVAGGAAGALALLLTSIGTAPAGAIVGGTDAPDTPVARSTVMVDQDRPGRTPVRCSGTLVAPDLVLSAGHCIQRPEVGDVPDPPFRGPDEPDWQRPDRYYPLPLPATISVGVRRADPLLTAKAHEYALPGLADMILLRLDRRVPASMAPPVPILTRLPSDVLEPAPWLHRQSFQIAGFGDDDDGPPGTVSTHLNLGRADRALFPCPRMSAGWEFGGAHKLCVESADGSGTRGGDSGGPLYWTSSSGERYLVGVYQGIERRNAGRYTAAFFRGGASFESRSLSNVGGWLEQHVQGRSGGTAFLWASDGAVSHVAPSTYAANPSGLMAHVRRLGVGDYDAVFEGLRHTAYREPRVALATAYGGDAYCKLRDAAAPDRVRVNCFDRAGRPADSRFSLLTDISDTDVLVRVRRLSAGATSVPSAHGAVRVTRIATGEYRVAADGFRGGWKNVLTTAEGTGSARCHPKSWSGATAVVRCMTTAGAGVDSGFTLAATAGDGSGYARADRETATTPYVASAASANVPGSDSLPTVRRAGPGRYRVEFTGAPANFGGNVQASAYGDTTNRCALMSWTPTAASVACRDVGGALADTKFVVRFVDPLDAGRAVELALLTLGGRSVDECGELDMYGDLRFAAGATGRADVPLASNVRIRRFRPAIGIAATTRPGVRVVTAELRIRDQDGSCGGSSPDDEVDIAGRPHVTRLRVEIDVQAHTVRVLDAEPPVLGGLGRWWSDGRDGIETGFAELDIDVLAPVGLI